ncbi:MAG TPA: flagellar filament capping protein FliD [Jatrophihabitans sp.]|jgi:flagellar hook-associated protein 2|nr:flagellar filament capping protein FliD [Jatrophihabitans sp.]
MTSPSSFNVSGLLGTNSIDTTALVSQLMQAQAIPQTQLKNQLSTQQSILYAYQQLNSKFTSLQTAAQALTDANAWAATAAKSSAASVVATSSTSASTGATTFDVTQLATAQISTVAVAGDGTVTADPTKIKIGSTTLTDVASGSATDVAAAINKANLGVRAAVVNTDGGTLLQLTSTTIGEAGAFAASGFDTLPLLVVPPQNAQITVGGPSPNAYIVTSPTNTFTDVIPGVTFSVSALASNVTITVASDSSSLSDQVKAIVDAANVVRTELGVDTGKGAVLQGNFPLQRLSQGLTSTVSQGTATGQTLKTYGIDIDKSGVLSFDAAAFAKAYATDPSGTKDGIFGAFAPAMNTLADQAIAPVTGTVTQGIAEANTASDSLNKQIDAWTTRLSDIQTRLQTKYGAMNAALARLQSQSTYLTSMLKSLNSNSSSSSN